MEPLRKGGLCYPVAENKEDTAMPIAHSSRFVVVDRMMQIRGFFDGTDVAEIRKLERAFFHVEPEMSPPSYAAEIFAGQDNITHLAGPPEVATTHWMKERQAQQLAHKKIQFTRLLTFSSRTSELRVAFLTIRKLLMSSDGECK